MENDWCAMSDHTYDRPESAKRAMDRQRLLLRYDNEYDYRMVKVTTITEWVGYE